MMGVLRGLGGLIGLGGRLTVCVAASIAYETYWFTTQHLVGYLWFINYYKAKENEIPALAAAMQDRFQLQDKILVYGIFAILVKFLLARGIIRVSGLLSIVWTSFWLAMLSFWAAFPVKAMTGAHFYIPFYQAIFTGFLLFANLTILSANIGPLFRSTTEKKKTQ